MPEKEKTKAIIFDLFGVIVQPGSLVKHNLYPMVKDKFSYEELKENYNKLQLGELSEKEFWQEIPDLHKVKKKMLSIFKPAPDLEYIQDLRDHFKLFVLSNVPDTWGNHLVKKFKLEKYFDRIFLSGCIGFQKPDKEAFQCVLDQTGFPAANCIFVDDRTMHLKTASALGMTTVWLKKGLYKQRHTKPDLSVKSLRELVDLLICR